MSMHRFRAIFLAGTIIAAGCFAATTAAVADAPAAPDFGANVHIFNPSMDQATIQAKLNAIAAAQVNNEFGPRRDAVLFEPGTYGTKSNPLNFQVGYYTEVAGLGLSPDDVVINGSIDVFDRCLGANGTNCLALVNFWRSMSNLELNVVTPRGGCRFGEFWAVSQAAPMRRVHVNGFTTLMDYCLQPAFASGGFIADSEFDNSIVINGSQQQWITRNTKVDLWTNAVWNQVFSGVVGAPAQSFPNPTDSAATINLALHRGKNLILTPGVYHLDQSIDVTRPDSVVLGLGFPTLVPDNGVVSMNVARAQGMMISG